MTKTVPTDDAALRAISHALDAALDVDECGTTRIVGAEYTLGALLRFWSGYDPTATVHIGFTDDGTAVYEHPDVVLSERDVIRALVEEVQRLRAERSTAT